jgi:hypothetical protein
MTWPAIVALVLIAICLVPRSPLPLLYLSFILSTITTLSLNPIEGGTNILPVCAAFFVCKIVLAADRLPKAVDAAIEPAKLNILFVFLAYALFTAYVLPRLFARMVEVVLLNPNSNWPVALMPISANYSQSAYLTLSVGVTLAFLGENSSFRRHFIQAVLVGGLSLIVTGIVDFTLTALGDTDLFEPFRNAKYSLLTNAEVEGARSVGIWQHLRCVGCHSGLSAALLGKSVVAQSAGPAHHFRAGGDGGGFSVVHRLRRSWGIRGGLRGKLVAPSAEPGRARTGSAEMGGNCRGGGGGDPSCNCCARSRSDETDL